MEPRRLSTSSEEQPASRISRASRSSSTEEEYAEYYTLYHGGTKAGLKRVMANLYGKRSGGEIDFTDGIYFTSSIDQAASWSEVSKDKHSSVVEMVVPFDAGNDIYANLTTLCFSPPGWDDAIQQQDCYTYWCTSEQQLKDYVGICREQGQPPAVILDTAHHGGEKTLLPEEWLRVQAVEAPICPNPKQKTFKGHQIFFTSSSRILEQCTKEIIDVGQ